MPSLPNRRAFHGCGLVQMNNSKHLVVFAGSIFVAPPGSGQIPGKDLPDQLFGDLIQKRNQKLQKILGHGLFCEKKGNFYSVALQNVIKISLMS